MSRTRCRWNQESCQSNPRPLVLNYPQPPAHRSGGAAECAAEGGACGSLRFRQNIYSGAPLGLSRDDQALDAEALRLNAPATKQGAQAPAERPRLARLGVARARRAFAAGELGSERGQVRPPSRTRTRSCRDSASQDRRRSRAKAPPAPRREDRAEARKSPSAGLGAADWWRRDCRRDIAA